MNTKKTWLVFPALFILICALLAGYFILIGSGMFNQPNLTLILLTAAVIILLSSSKKTFYFILLPLSLLHPFHIPLPCSIFLPQIC